MNAGEATTAKIMALLDEIRRESYEQGWKDALRSIVEAATLPPKQEIATGVTATATAPTQAAIEPEARKSPRGPGAPAGKRLRRGVAEEIVLLVLDAHHGGITIRGIEEASADLGTGLQPQSIRPVLLRLEQAGRVARDGRLWLLTQNEDGSGDSTAEVATPMPRADEPGGDGPDADGGVSGQEPPAT